MAEKLVFQIANNKIAELFGMQNFTSKEVAILELVKNSFDSGATKLTISIENDRLVIDDNGIGMTKEIIRNKWMAVGSSDKKYDFIAINNETRVYSGSKGIGRFALARLGKNIELISKTENEGAIIWKTDWNENLLDDYERNEIGTKIIVTHLNDVWNEKEAGKLANYISFFKFHDSFEVLITHNGKEYNCTNVFSGVSLNENALSQISFSFNSEEGILVVDIINDEFSDEAQKRLDDFNKNSNRVVAISINHYKKQIDVQQRIAISGLQTLIDSKDDLKNVGDFKGSFFFNNKYTKKHADEFLYKWPKPVEEFPQDLSGLFLVRNSFCVSGYSGETDWLGFGKRARKSPAAASHKTGRWRVRENQIAGAIYIDKKLNSGINELQNRQGIEENSCFLLLKYVVELVLDTFEEYRQSIVRIVDMENDSKSLSTSDELKYVNLFVKNPSSIEKMSKKQISDLADNIKVVIDNSKQEKELYVRKQEDLDYSLRLLNSLSTLGLKSASIAHDLNNKRNNISAFYDSMINALKKYNYWDVLSDEYHTKQKAFNIPELLSDVNGINNTIINYIDSMLNTINKRKFEISLINVYETIIEICNEWQNEYSWIEIHVDADEQEMFFSSKDVFETILSNLILNSIQQNEKNKKLPITITIKCNNGYLEIIYRDGGVGLPEMFKNDPYRILEPHVSSRKDGHGLGMWIVYNTIVNNKGRVIDINSNNGFLIDFSLMEAKK